MDGILGTTATTTSDLVLLAYVFILLPGMIVGFFFARRKMFVPYHKFTMTGVTLVNWVLIAYVMLVSYSYSVAPQLPGNLNQLYALIATLHLVTGAFAQAFATYLIVLMWTERTRFERILPAIIRIRRIKTPMRVTLGLWITTVVLGLGLYFTWYLPGAQDASTVPPGATEEANPAVTPELSAQVAVTEASMPPAVTEDATSDVAITEALVPPAVTEDATSDVAVTEALIPPAVTKDATSDVAVTEAVTPPAVTEEVSPRSTSTKKAPATTEEVRATSTPTPRPSATPARPRSTSTKKASATPGSTSTKSARPAVSEDVRSTPAVTEGVEDNSGRGSSNSGQGSSNSGKKDD